jgi:hypothetical protein
VHGSVLVELASIVWIVPVFALLSLNVGILVFGSWTCDAACRDAARAAGGQTGGSWSLAKQNALNAAKAAVRPLAGVSYPFTPPTVDEASFQYWSYGLDAQGNAVLDQGPCVQVTVRMAANLPCPVIWASAGFTGQVNFVQSYTYPVMNPPAQAGGP